MTSIVSVIQPTKRCYSVERYNSYIAGVFVARVQKVKDGRAMSHGALANLEFDQWQLPIFISYQNDKIWVKAPLMSIVRRISRSATPYLSPRAKIPRASN